MFFNVVDFYFSALLAAAAPDRAPFMADECLKAIPAIEGIDYTAKEYLNFVDHIQNTVERLNSECEYHIYLHYTSVLTLHFTTKKLQALRVHGIHIQLN